MTWRNYTKTRKVIKPTNCTDTAVDRFGLLIWLKWKGNWKQQDLGKTMNYCHASLDTQEHARHAKTCITLHHSNTQYPGGTRYATCRIKSALCTVAHVLCTVRFLVSRAAHAITRVRSFFSRLLQAKGKTHLLLSRGRSCRAAQETENKNGKHPDFLSKKNDFPFEFLKAVFAIRIVMLQTYRRAKEKFLPSGLK